MRSRLIRLIAALATGVVLVTVSAYAGTVTGTIKWEGPVPPMKPYDLSADPHCAAMHKDKPIINEALVLGENKTIANIIVTVTKGLPEGKTYPVPSEPVVLTQKGCQYSPHVFVVRVGQTLKILNPDGVMHNVDGLPRLNRPFNRAMPGPVKEIEVKFTKPEPGFPIKCDVHPWMRAYCAVVDNPFFDVTGKDGVFKIDGLAPGTYEITAWQERLGPQTATVTVTDDKPATHDFTFSRPHH